LPGKISKSWERKTKIVTVQKFFCEIHVVNRTKTSSIIEYDRHSGIRAVGNSRITANHGIKNQVAASLVLIQLLQNRTTDAVLLSKKVATTP